MSLLLVKSPEKIEASVLHLRETAVCDEKKLIFTLGLDDERSGFDDKVKKEGEKEMMGSFESCR